MRDTSHRKYIPKLMRAIVLLWLFVSFLSGAQAQGESVALYYHRPLEQAIFTAVTGSYDIMVRDRLYGKLHPEETAYITAIDSIILFHFPGAPTIRTDSIMLIPVCQDTLEHRFRLEAITTTLPTHIYPGSLVLTVVHGILLPVNHVSEESYIAAVTEAEIGGNAPEACVEAQAIVVRTYLATAGARHRSEGFDICDGVHCQAYQGIGEYFDRILDITRKTAGMILTGPDGQPAIIAYHSNSGGETADARDVWLVSRPFLKRIKDPYSLNGRHSDWQREIPLDTWRRTLTDLGMRSATSLPASAFETRQIHRTPEYLSSQGGIPFRLLREKLALPSAFFSVTVTNNRVILVGHGYGHGLGLSQEGAIEMAKKGFSATQILEFYFPGIYIWKKGKME